jgi:protein-S-isoprenylcysteine O-methyltransferase Ste14
MVVSTYITFSKLFRGSPLAETAGRVEPLVVEGPQKYVRNPLYFALIVVVFGWALAAESTYVLVWSAVLLLWFRLILIPFEERELRELFGSQYANYVEAVPMLIPFTKRRRRQVSGGQFANPSQA